MFETERIALPVRSGGCVMPTYYEVYSKCSTEGELIAKMKDDTIIAVLFG